MAYGYTLVPEEFFSEENAREILSEVVPLDKEEPFSFLRIPDQPIYLLFSGRARPVVYEMIHSLFKIKEFNKILASIEGQVFHLVVARDMRIEFCNYFKTTDFATVIYYLCLVLKRLQINPQVSTVFFTSELSDEQTKLILSYFKGVEVLR